MLLISASLRIGIIQVSRFVDPDWLVEIEVDAVIQQA